MPEPAAPVLLAVDEPSFLKIRTLRGQQEGAVFIKRSGAARPGVPRLRWAAARPPDPRSGSESSTAKRRWLRGNGLKSCSERSSAESPPPEVGRKASHPRWAQADPTRGGLEVPVLHAEVLRPLTLVGDVLRDDLLSDAYGCQVRTNQTPQGGRPFVLPPAAFPPGPSRATRGLPNCGSAHMPAN